MDSSSIPPFSIEDLRTHALPMVERLGEQFAATPWVGLLVGVAVLLFGRRLFWLLLTAVGLLAGFAFAERFFPQTQPWISLAVGVVAGLVAIAVARFVQKLAVAIAAFLVGGYTALWLATNFGAMAAIAAGTGELAPWVVFGVGGAVAALFGQYFFRLALIVISSVAGAFLIVQALPLEPAWTPLALAGLTFVGIFAQRRRPKRE